MFSQDGKEFYIAFDSSSKTNVGRLKLPNALQSLKDVVSLKYEVYEYPTNCNKKAKTSGK